VPKCRNPRCEEMIHFDPAFKSDSGKFIPLGEDDEPHNCPHNPYSIDLIVLTEGIQKMESKIDTLNKNILKLILAVQTV
jgi:hypothetical protein